MSNQAVSTHNKVIGYVPRELTFESNGVMLRSYLYLPPGRGPFPCVVNNHGSHLRTGGSDVSRPHMAALMIGWGYGFLFPHRRGYGNSPGVSVAQAIPAPLGSEEYDRQIVLRLSEECDDVAAAIAKLRTLPEIDGDRIAVSGSSRGGILSFLAAARDKKLRCAINFCGGARQWAEHPMLRRTMLNAASKLTQPIFLAQAENDFNKAATEDLADELKRLGKPYECHIYPPWGFTQTEGHLFEVHGSLVWGGHVRDFLSQHLT
ncbi:MAG: alpha/beta hydrolase family protein, partial [Methyloligellaceae bacterium]